MRYFPPLKEMLFGRQRDRGHMRRLSSSAARLCLALLTDIPSGKCGEEQACHWRDPYAAERHGLHRRHSAEHSADYGYLWCPSSSSMERWSSAQLLQVTCNLSKGVARLPGFPGPVFFAGYLSSGQCRLAGFPSAGHPATGRPVLLQGSQLAEDL